MKQHKIKITVPLTYPLPLREWYQRENGLWASREWTEESRRKANDGRVKLVEVRV